MQERAATTEAPSAALGGLGQIALRVSDIRQATTFYRDVLGLPLLFEAPPALAFFDCRGIRLMLAEPETPPAGEEAISPTVLYFEVSDVDAAHAALRSKGVRFEAEPHRVHRAPDHELWMAFFHDGVGNLLALMETRRI